MPLDDAIGPDPVDIAIGARMRLRRKSLGISQGVLSERVGVSFQQIQKYERGANRVSGSMLVAIAAALDTSVGWLVGEEMSRVLGQRIVMENMGGAGGATALTRAARAEPASSTGLSPRR